MPSRSIIRTGVGPHREPGNRFPAMAAAINLFAARAARVQSRRNLSRSLSPKLDHSHSITRFDRSRTGPYRKTSCTVLLFRQTEPPLPPDLYQVPEGVTRSGFQREAGLIQGGERGRFAMPVPLRTDFDANALRAIARQTKDGPQARRLLALAAIYDGASRTEAARIGGVTVQIVRDGVVKFNAHGPAGLVNRKPPGQPSKLTNTHRAALLAIVEQGPIPAIHGVVRWRLIDLIAWIWEEFGISIAKQTLSRELRALNYRKLSARPRHHAKNERAITRRTSAPSREERARHHAKNERAITRRTSAPSREERARHHAKNEAAVAAFNKTSRPVRRSLRRPMPAASPSRSGLPMRPGWARRTRSPGAGPNAARARQPPRTKGPPRPTSSGRSARLRARARAWFCPAARPRA